MSMHPDIDPALELEMAHAEQSPINAKDHEMNRPKEKHETRMPTASHELANTDPEESGVAQRMNEETEDKDLGWKEDAKAYSDTFLGGLSNDEVWTLIRRFNKQMFHLKSVPDRPVRVSFSRTGRRGDELD